jgi:hypothetical protein
MYLGNFGTSNVKLVIDFEILVSIFCLPPKKDFLDFFLIFEIFRISENNTILVSKLPKCYGRSIMFILGREPKFAHHTMLTQCFVFQICYVSQVATIRQQVGNLTNFFWFDQVAILVKAKLENLLQGQI